MKRLLILCTILAAVAFITAPVFAEVQNVKVSGDINSGGAYRANYDIMSTNQTANGQNEDNSFLYTQARVRIDADLTDNVATTVRFLTEYDWDTQANTSGAGDDVDLDLANVTLKEAFYAPLTVTLGRQELRYGNAFIIGDPDTNTTDADAELTAGDLSLRKSFDAIKAVVDYSPLVVDVIYAKIDETTTALGGNNPTTNTADDEDLYGVNAAYDIGQYNAEAEAYWFFNRQNDQAATNGDEIHTFGVRGSATPIDNLSLLAEIAWQRGDFDKQATNARPTKRDQDALAYQIAGDYTFADINIPWIDVAIVSPALKLGWTHYDGEETGNAGDNGAWIPLYEDQTHGVVANHILGGVNGGQNSNADILNVGGSFVPLQDLTLSVDFYKFWLDEKLVANDNEQASNYTALMWTNLTEANYWMNTSDDLGHEIDIALNYDYTEDVKTGLSLGWFKPGDAFDGANNTTTNDETAIQVLATLDVSF